MSVLKILSASAGSGKTYALTQEYLTLAYENPEKFTSILAVTFTNKAAEEMKTRIINELVNIIENGTEAPHFKHLKSRYKSRSDAEIRQYAQTLLNSILHNYSFFAISTIDSFVQKVIRAFAYEMGLQSDFDIELDEQKVINDLTQQLYSKLQPGSDILRWLVQYSFFRMEQGKKWDFKEEVAKLAREIFKEEFQKFAYGDSELRFNKQALELLFDEVLSIKNDFEEKMRQIGSSAEHFLAQKSVINNACGRSFSSICKYLTVKIVEPATIDDYTPNKTVFNALGEVDKWYAKSADSKIKEAVQELFPDLDNFLSDALQVYDADFQLYVTAKNILSNFYAFGLLNDIANELVNYRTENNLLLISDTTRLLKEIVTNNETPYIYEKTGNRYQNILIDEFQDTSGFQWHVFKPLMKNSLANAQSGLIVGDIKQSIYRWRGGDWSLLLYQIQKDIGEIFTKKQTLDNNWRSRVNIIDFNNFLFYAAPKVLQKQFNSEINENENYTSDELEQNGYETLITDAYADSYQNLPIYTTKIGGKVSVKFVNCKNRSDARKKWRKEVDKSLAKQINDLIQNDGYKPEDIAILVRKNKDGQQIVNLLLEYMNNTKGAEQYGIISPDSLFIANAPSVRIIINALHYITNQCNPVRLSALLFEYTRYKADDAADINYQKLFKVTKEELQDYLPAEFLNRMKYLRKLPLFELVEELIYIFELYSDVTEQVFIRTFQDAVSDYTRNIGVDIFGFLDWWHTEGNTISIQLSENTNALQIMTIHKAKGLAFKVVIIPYCDWSLDIESAILAPILWTRPDIEPFNRFPYLPIRYKKELLYSYFAKDYITEKLFSYIDSLNMMYVAFTRSVDELIVYAPNSKTDKITQVSDLLFHAIKGEYMPPADNKEKHYINIKDFYDQSNKLLCIDYRYRSPRERAVSYKTSMEKRFHLEEYPVSFWRDKISIARESTDFFRITEPALTDNINYGTVMHKIMSRIKTREDIDLAIQQCVFNGLISHEQSADIKQKIVHFVTNEKVADWFTDNWKILNEEALLTSSGHLRIPDRVLLKDKKCVVIDFKFAKPIDEHHQQVKEYVDLLEGMDYQNVAGYLYYPERDMVEKV